MRVRSSQDVATGILFIAIAAIALVVSRNYPMGTWRAPGSGVLPYIVSWGLVGIGVIMTLKGLLVQGTALSSFGWRSLLLVLASVVTFARFVDSLGMIVTMIISMTLCALATPETRWKEYLGFCAIMLLISWGLFIAALGMPIPTWPVRVPPDVAAIVDLFKTVVR